MEESTMTSKTQNAEIRPLDDHEIDIVCGGFTLIELLVQINQISIIMGMQAPATTVNPNHRD
jgi:type II secretory pathway pseudopilin PulG